MRERVAARVCVGVTVVLVVVAALGAGAGTISPTALALRIAAASISWAGVVAYGGALGRREALWLAALGATAAGAVLLAAPPVLSDDVYRYLWDGRVLGHGIDPYRYAPDDPALAVLRDALWARVNNPQIATIYPPLAELLFALIDRVSHAPLGPKALALVAHLATIPVVDALARSRRIEAPRPAAAAPLAFALCPLGLAESALAGHVDAVCALLLALAVLALLRGRAFASAVALAAAASVKLVGLVLVPLLWRRSRTATALALVLALAPVALLTRAGSSEAPGGLSSYVRRWRGNEGAFVVLEAGTTVVTAGVARLTNSSPRHVRLPLLRPLLTWLHGSPLDPRLGLTGPKKAVPDVADFQIAYVAALLARLLALALVLALAVRCARRGTDPLAAARAVILATLLLGPQLHPWYVLWLLPLECASGGLAGLVLAAVVLVAYAPLDAWATHRAGAVPGLARAAEHGLVWLAIAWELRPPRKLPAPPS